VSPRARQVLAAAAKAFGLGLVITVLALALVARVSFLYPIFIALGSPIAQALISMGVGSGDHGEIIGIQFGANWLLISGLLLAYFLRGRKQPEPTTASDRQVRR
jgi:hypothetical protein